MSTNNFKKIVICLLPIILFFGLGLIEKTYDNLFGDGDGVISLPIYNRLYPFISIMLFVASFVLFNKNFFKIETKVVVANIVVVVVIIYGFEFYLKRKDPFLKLPFDSNYYYGMLWKYENHLTPPAGIDKLHRLTWGKTVFHNQEGFRDVEFKPVPDSTFLVMVLGDSFTWGVGLDTSERYSNRVQDSLRKLFPKKSIVVRNFGIPGGPTVMERDVLRKYKEMYKPDLIVVGFCVNDPQTESEDYSVEKEAFDKKNESKFKNIQNFFAGVRLNYIGELVIKGITMSAQKRGEFPDLNTSLSRVYDKKSVAWNKFEKALADIKNISDSVHCVSKPILAVFNQIGIIHIPNDTTGIYRADPIRMNWFKQVRETGVAHGFEVINYEPSIEAELLSGSLSKDDLMVSPLDAHPSASLNRIYSYSIIDIIKKNINANEGKPLKE